MPCSAAAARQRSAAAAARSSRSTAVPATRRSPARLSASSSPTVWARRSTSTIAASSSAATSPLGSSAWASSRRRRSPVSGVRSWCEASATKSRWAPSSRSSRLVISLNEAASERCSRLPSTSARAVEVALRHAPGHLLQPADRPADLGRDHRAGGETERQHDQPDQRSPRTGRGGPRCARRRCSASPARRRPSARCGRSGRPWPGSPVRASASCA